MRAAAETGYQGVELAPPEHWALIKRYGLTIATIGGHASLTSGLNRRENLPGIRKELEENLRLAVQWGIPNLIVFSGNRDGLDDETGKQVTAENLRSLTKLAEEAGVMLILELLNSKVDHRGYQCDHTAWGLDVCRMVDSPSVRLLYDIYHMQVMEGDVIQTIRAHHQWFAHYHTAGVPGRRDLDEMQELYYPAIMREIATTGYHGFVGQEFMPKGDPVEALKKAYNLCQIVS